jgi:hypothetical protein
MRRYIRIDGTILFTQSLNDSGNFFCAIKDFVEHSGPFRPSHWGFTEPLNKKLDLDILHTRLTETGETYFAWSRKVPPKGWGVFRKLRRPLRGPQHARHSFFVSANSEAQAKVLLDYIRNVEEKFGVQYACCDVLTAAYEPTARANGLAPYGDISVYTHQLTNCLPDVLWCQVFGPAYVRMFGLDKLMAVPAYNVEKIGPEAVYIQLTESIFDSEDTPEAVDEARQRVKKYLAVDAFFDPSLPSGHQYRTPVFQFSEEP